METKVFTYSTELQWTGARRASLRAGDSPEIVVAPPLDFPSGDNSSWSPEELLLASIQSCTMLSFIAHCAHHGLELVSYESRAQGRLERRESDRRYAFTGIDMTVHARMAGGHAASARELTAKAERDCFISASLAADVRTDWRVIE